MPCSFLLADACLSRASYGHAAVYFDCETTLGCALACFFTFSDFHNASANLRSDKHFVIARSGGKREDTTRTHTVNVYRRTYNSCQKTTRKNYFSFFEAESGGARGEQKCANFEITCYI